MTDSEALECAKKLNKYIPKMCTSYDYCKKCNVYNKKSGLCKCPFDMIFDAIKDQSKKKEAANDNG